MAYQVKNLPAMQETQETWGSAPGLGRSPGGGKGTPLQYSHQENPLDREAWWATAHGITKSWTQLMSEHRAHVKRPALPQLNCELPTSCTPKFMIPTLQMRKLRYYTPSPAGLIFQFRGKRLRPQPSLKNWDVSCWEVYGSCWWALVRVAA